MLKVLFLLFLLLAYWFQGDPHILSSHHLADWLDNGTYPFMPCDELLASFNANIAEEDTTLVNDFKHNFSPVGLGNLLGTTKLYHSNT